MEDGNLDGCQSVSHFITIYSSPVLWFGVNIMYCTSSCTNNMHCVANEHYTTITSQLFSMLSLA